MTQSWIAARAMRIAACSLILAAACALSSAAMAVNVSTYHYDNLRTGWNPNETQLTPYNISHTIGSTSFKMTSFTTLDEQVDAQPLLVTNQSIQGKGVHDVVYVATENNTLYAIDATSGAILRSRHFGPPVPISALPGGCNNNSGNVGIGGTPVIDTAGSVIYLIDYTYFNNTPRYTLHEIDLSSLADVVAIKQVSASGLLSNGRKYYFHPGASRQRAALLLANGNVYAGFASFCDVSADISRGWVLGWQKDQLTPLGSNELANRLPTSPDSFFLSSIWMSGYGLASSPSTGDIYFVTGNSDYSGDTVDSVNNVAESVVQMSADLSTVKSVFTPDNVVDLEHGDVDFGSGGFTLLPAQTGAASQLGVAAGKDGNMYFLNADNLNNNTTGAHRILGTYGIGGCWCGQSYFTGSNNVGYVVSSGGDSINLWRVHPGTHSYLSFVRSMPSVGGAQDPGFFTAISSNGNSSTSAIIWAVSRPDGTSAENVSLYAFNTAGTQLFSANAGTWPNTGGNSNIAPVEANGKVYVASYEGLAIFARSSAPGASVPSSLKHVIVARASIQPGLHEVYGMVRAINGTKITVQKRDGKTLIVEAREAIRTMNFAEPALNHGILVRGTYNPDGTMLATTVLHAKPHAQAWLPDR